MGPKGRVGNTLIIKLRNGKEFDLKGSINFIVHKGIRYTQEGWKQKLAKKKVTK